MCFCWLFNTSWLSLETCCGCLDTAQGTVLTALICIIACFTTLTCNVLGILYWIPFTDALHQHYNSTGVSYDYDVADFSLKLLWWGNIITLFFTVTYVFLCVLMIIGVQRRQHNYIIPWISISTMVIPFGITLVLFKLIIETIGDNEQTGRLMPTILLAFPACCVWMYGICCALSHYRVLKGDLHRSIPTFPNEDFYHMDSS